VSDGTPPGRYTFGDSAVAAERLRLVAETFAPSSREFLDLVRRELGHAPALAVDVGSGLGLTARLLKEALSAECVVGLDRSRTFLDLAEAEATSGISFVEHDVGRGPLPISGADLLYCRFLLTHLHAATQALRLWMGALAPGGLLAIEELEHLSSPHPALAAYYEILEAMQRSYGQDTFIGRRLDSLVGDAGWIVRSSRVRPVDVAGRRMAHLHLLNFETWSNDPFVRRSYPPERIAGIERGLRDVVAGQEAEPAIDYRIRQLVAAATS
jgi:SAM-dependent methyltransferase